MTHIIKHDISFTDPVKHGSPVITHTTTSSMQRRCNYDNCSFDSLFPEEEEEELTFLEACMDCDEDAVYDMIQDGMTPEQVNERDRSGRVSVICY